MRILVVEDDKTIASFVTKGLRQAGFAVDHAGNGEFSDVLGGFTGGAAYLGFGINWIERRRVSGESPLPPP